jgi:hypothetical protein
VDGGIHGQYDECETQLAAIFQRTFSPSPAAKEEEAGEHDRHADGAAVEQNAKVLVEQNRFAVGRFG